MDSDSSLGSPSSGRWLEIAAPSRSRISCGCGCAAKAADSAEARAPRGGPGASIFGGVLTALGILGWLSVPKCPLCLAAYIAIGSGVSMSLAQSQALRQTLFVLAGLLIVAGAARLAAHVVRFRRIEPPCNPPRPESA